MEKKKKERKPTTQPLQLGDLVPYLVTYNLLCSYILSEYAET